MLEPVVRELGRTRLTTDATVAKVSIVGAGCATRRATPPACSGRSPTPGQHRDDLDLRGPDHLHDRRGPLETAPRAARGVRARAAGARRRRRGGRLTTRDVDGRGRHVVAAPSGSPPSSRPTTSCAAGWCGAPRSLRSGRRCAGRRPWPRGRSWIAPPSTALLLSPGFRPTWPWSRHSPGGSPRPSRWRWPRPARRTLAPTVRSP